MRSWEVLQLEEFLSRNPKMRLVRYDSEGVRLDGAYELNARLDGFQSIREVYELTINIPRDYPKGIPDIIDRGQHFPRDPDHHTYKDGSFCLGSEIKLKAVLAKDSTLCGFASNILDPYLYSVGYKLRFDEYPYGQLAHGEAGLIDDYERIFGLTGKKAVILALSALGRRKRVANKQRCPCCCGERLGKCAYRFKLNVWRSLDRRRWYREHLSLFTPIERPRSKKPTKRKRRRASTAPKHRRPGNVRGRQENATPANSMGNAFGSFPMVDAPSIATALRNPARKVETDWFI